MARSATGMALLAAALFAAMAAVAVDQWGPAPSADAGRGTEDAFATGLHRRELPPRQAPIRWTTGRVAFAFDRLPAGEADLEVAVAGHRGPVVVAADGVVVGVVPVGATTGTFHLAATARSSRSVQLEVPAFAAGDGRQLGTRLQRVSLRPSSSSAPALGLLALFILPALVAAVVGRGARLGGVGAATLAMVVTVVQTAILWPCGLSRAPYATRLAVLIVTGLVAAGAFAWWMERRRPGAARWALVAMAAAWIVQGVLATSPVMVVSDAVFHANTLARVAAGDLFPTSITQHAPPFRFPYGVSFYALLAPLLRAGIDGVTLVRVGAAIAGILASAALFVVLLESGAAIAGLAVVLLQLLPATFDVPYSYGNLSNAFGQSATIVFFAWWAGRAAGRWPTGAILLALAATAHFSSLVVVIALAAALAIARRDERDRTRTVALVLGVTLSAAYYAHHVGLVASQLPRLLEGGRGAEGGGLTAAVGAQLMGAILGWGPAVTVLAWFGRPRWHAGGLDRDLAAWWVGCGLLAVPAIVSPLEVRYLYALAPAVAAAGGRGAVALYARGGAWRAAAVTLVAGQVAIGGWNLAEAVLVRYRP